MIGAAGGGEAYWLATAPETSFPTLPGDITVDVAIIGGGIVGLTAAALLKEAGRSVAVIEARRVGRQATGRSTAKVTSQHALIYAELVRTHGRDRAKIYADANQAAVERVAAVAREIGIDCDFERKAAYVYSCSPDRVGLLEEEVECARSLGIPAEFAREVPLPFPVEGAVRFSNQAQFHPCKYLAGLAHHVGGGGCHVFENTRATNVETASPMRVVTELGTVTAEDVIVATHLPITNQGMFFAKAYPHSEPVLAAQVDASKAPDGLFISADAPTLSVLRAPTGDRPYLIAAGGSYKPGHAEEAREAFEALERTVRDHFGVGEIGYRWTNHDYRPMDRVPFVGSATAGHEHLHVATGFNAWGLSNGTVAAMILADRIAGRPNSWAAVFGSTRSKPVASAPAFVSENLQVAKHLAGGYLARHPGSPHELAAGDAGVFSVDGSRIAAYRDQVGELHQVSAVCTHMKCIVGWNPADRTWDCPCHGSRFSIDGEVLGGPAVSPLARRD